MPTSAAIKSAVEAYDNSVFELTTCREQSPSWDADKSTAIRAVPLILCNPKFYYRVHKIRQLARILSQRNPVHALPTDFFKIPFNTTLPSTSRSSTWYLSFSFRNLNPVCISHLPRTCCMALYVSRVKYTRWPAGNMVIVPTYYRGFSFNEISTFLSQHLQLRG
jgi:hypothetical protein